MEGVKFGFEELEVWQRAVEFAKKVIHVAEKIQTDRKHYRLIEQLEAASTSIALNIAEGKGRFSTKEFVRFLYKARGSLFETINQFTVVSNLGWTHQSTLNEIKTKGEQISKMLNGLIKALKEKSS